MCEFVGRKLERLHVCGIGVINCRLARLYVCGIARIRWLTTGEGLGVWYCVNMLSESWKKIMSVVWVCH